VPLASAFWTKARSSNDASIERIPLPKTLTYPTRLKYKKASAPGRLFAFKALPTSPHPQPHFTLISLLEILNFVSIL
jgi:hypothetical protein